jgi:DNA-binding NarL/FixJ family response regulator
MPIRILLVAMPRLTRDIVEAALRDHPDVAVAGTLQSPDGLAAAVRRSAPDVVLIGADHAAVVEQCELLFEERPRLRMLELEPVTGDAHVYELRPRGTHLGPVSARELVAAIRSAMSAPSWAEELG